jgi:hypothetical protein
LSYLKEKIQLEAETRQLDNPVRAQDMTAENRKFRNPRIEQHTTGRGSRHDSSLEGKH